MDITKPCRDINELDEDTQFYCKKFLDECKKHGLNVLITETYRSQERQNYLYEQGRTRPGQVVTWTRNSNHTGRRAFDICKNVKGHEYDDDNFFKQCANIAKQVGLDAGYYWKNPQDKPHIELPKGVIAPKKQKIRIDGKMYETETKIIDGTTYIKLRDFEKAGYKVDYINGIPTIDKK